MFRKDLRILSRNEDTVIHLKLKTHELLASSQVLKRNVLRSLPDKAAVMLCVCLRKLFLRIGIIHGSRHT